LDIFDPGRIDLEPCVITVDIPMIRSTLESIGNVEVEVFKA
jgi:hypothetical protein